MKKILSIIIVLLAFIPTFSYASVIWQTVASTSTTTNPIQSNGTILGVTANNFVATSTTATSTLNGQLMVGNATSSCSLTGTSPLPCTTFASNSMFFTWNNATGTGSGTPPFSLMIGSTTAQAKAAVQVYSATIPCTGLCNENDFSRTGLDGIDVYAADGGYGISDDFYDLTSGNGGSNEFFSGNGGAQGNGTGGGGGGDFIAQAGNGGVGPNPGYAGFISFITGNGAHATVTGTNGGNFNITTGNAGGSTFNSAAKGGDIILTGGTGINNGRNGEIIASSTNLYLQNELIDSTNASGTSNQVLVSTGTSTLWVATSTLGFGGGGGTNYFTNSAATTSLTTGSILTAGSSTFGQINATSTTASSTFAGSVAIGTTTASTTGLTIQGNAFITGNIITSSTTSTSTFADDVNINGDINISNGLMTSNIINAQINVNAPNGISFGGCEVFLPTGINQYCYSIALMSNNNGYVGINTTNSTGPLMVASSTGSVLFTVAKNGNVGVGTTSPIATFSVQGSTTNPTADLVDIASSSKTDVFTIKSNGNVGIGTSTPATALSVIGTTTTQGLNISNLSNTVLAVDSNGNVIATTSAGGGGSQTPWTSNINGGGYNLTNVGIASSTQYISGDGSVSNPAYAFSNGTTGLYRDGAIHGIDFTVGGTYAGIISATQWLLPTGSILSGGNTGDSEINFTATPSSSTPPYTFIGNTNTGIFNPVTNTVGVSTNGSEEARFTTTGLGIGTSTPANTLDVYGSTRLESASSSFVTSSISGAIVTSGCDSATTSVSTSISSSTTAFITTPQIFPGAGTWWYSYLSASGVVTTSVCADLTVTPTASAYVVKIIQ